MSATLKQLTELKQICTEQEKIAYNIQEEIGLSLLDSNSELLEEDILNQYQESLAKSSQIKDKISSVKELSEEIDGNQNALQENKKALDEYNTKKTASFAEIGRGVYQNYRDSYSDFFKTYYDEVQEIEKKCSLLESQSENIKSQIENQGFFGKLVNQVKLSSSSSSLSSNKKKIEAIFKNAGSAIVSNQKIDFISSQEGLEYELATILDSFKQIQSEIDSLSKEKAELLEKDKALKTDFANAADGGSLKAKLSNLEKADEVQIQLRNKLAHDEGEKFTSKYVNPEGERLDGFDGIIGEYPSIESLSNSFKAISQAKLQLEIYQVEADMESCLSRTASMQQSIVSNENKIEKLKKANEEFAEKIVKEGELKDSLVAKKAELQSKLDT